VFGELLNVTLGRLLTELEGEAPVFDLTPPEVMLADDAAPWLEAVANPSTHAFTVDGSPVLLRLTSDV